MSDSAPLQLYVESGKRRGERIPLEPGSILVGTGRQSGVVFRDAGVSFKHATLHVGRGRAELEAAETRGGTWFGDDPLEPGARVPLRPGDRFRLGSVELRLTVPPPPRLLTLSLGLEVLTGKRAGESMPLRPGARLLGSSRQADVSLRAAGVSFKHAQLRVDAYGLGVVEDLDARDGTWLNGEPLTAREPAALKPWDTLRLGPELQLRLTATLTPDGDATPFLNMLPTPLWPALPEDVLDFAAEPEAGAWLIPTLDTLELGAADRDGLERDARRMLVELGGLVRPEHLPPRLELWLRRDPRSGELSLVHEDDRGLALAWRRWELIARLPYPAKGAAHAVAVNAVSRLFRGADRLLPQETHALSDGWWHVVYRSEQAILQAFERIDAWSNGRVLVACMRPHFAIRPLQPDRGEDPIGELLAEQQARRLWRPPPRGVGPAAPQLPPGGREGRRPLPKRGRDRES